MRTVKLLPTITLAVCAVIIAGSLSFLGGMQYQKSKNKTTVDAAGFNTQSFGGGATTFGGPNGGMRPTRGTVASITGETMKVTTQSGETTVALSSKTSVTDAATNASASVGDIKVNDTVLVFGTTGSDNTITATQIILNPPVGNQMIMNGNGPSTSIQQ